MKTVTVITRYVEYVLTAIASLMINMRNAQCVVRQLIWDRTTILLVILMVLADLVDSGDGDLDFSLGLGSSHFSFLSSFSGGGGFKSVL